QPRFREFRVLLPDAGTMTELTFALREALAWMTEVLGDPEGMNPYADLETTVRRLHEFVPGVLEFLRLFPLLLMTLHDHNGVLGVPQRNGCSLDFVTRYTPPWGAGKVHQRTLHLRDRTTPNAMGIPHRLLRHPLLVLPVIYHEALRHLGASETDGQGI